VVGRLLSGAARAETTAAADARPLSLALLSPTGHGNLGDAAVQTAVLQHVSRLLPGARVCGITLVPSDTERRHGIPAHPLAGLSMPDYTQVEAAPPAPAAAGTGRPAEDAGRATASRAGAARRRLRGLAVALGRHLRRLAVALARRVLPRDWPWKANAELGHVRRALALLGDVDVVIASGGGQLDDFWGGPFGHPWALFKWAALARLRGRGFVVLATGFGTLESRTSRLLTRAALHLSAHRSYRDRRCRELMARAGFWRDDPVVPDLAFALDPAALEPPTHDAAPEPDRVAVCPMALHDPRSWPVRDADAYGRYVERTAGLVEALLRRGRQVSLLTSDTPDRPVVADVVARLRAPDGDATAAGPAAPATLEVARFVAEAARARLVVASRLHGVILSFVAGTPVVALSYDRKVADLMEVMGQSELCLDVSEATPEAVLRRIDALEAREDAVRSAVRARRDALRAELDAYLARLLRTDWRAGERP